MNCIWLVSGGFWRSHDLGITFDTLGRKPPGPPSRGSTPTSKFSVCSELVYFFLSFSLFLGGPGLRYLCHPRSDRVDPMEGCECESLEDIPGPQRHQGNASFHREVKGPQTRLLPLYVLEWRRMLPSQYPCFQSQRATECICLCVSV